MKYFQFSFTRKDNDTKVKEAFSRDLDLDVNSEEELINALPDYNILSVKELSDSDLIEMFY